MIPSPTGVSKVTNSEGKFNLADRTNLKTVYQAHECDYEGTQTVTFSADIHHTNFTVSHRYIASTLGKLYRNMMAYSPPLDAAIVLFLLFGTVAIPAFLGVIFVEIIVLWLFGWGGFLRSVLTSFVMNLASTVVGIIMAFSSATELTVSTFLQLFIVSIGIEGLVMLGMKRPEYGMLEVWWVAFIANFVSYILLAVGLVSVFALGFIL